MNEEKRMLNNLSEALLNQTLEELTDKALQIFIFQTEEQVKELRKQLEQCWENKIQIPPKQN